MVAAPGYNDDQGGPGFMGAPAYDGRSGLQRCPGL